MKQEKDFIEVPFGARDSELGEFEYTIPQGFEAEIKDGKVIVRKAESEDEKIVDAIRKALKSKIEDLGSGVTKTACLAWLEKQREQKHVECCADKLWTEFQKQVAYLMASSYNREYEYTKGYVEWVAQSLLGYAKNEIEQKPAWSEEDEITKNNISHIIRQYDKISKGENQPCWYVGDCLLWMQNIKDRVQPQSNWEPSDEDMEFLQKICRTK